MRLGRCHLDGELLPLLYTTNIFTLSRSFGWPFTVTVFSDVSRFESKIMAENAKQFNSEDKKQQKTGKNLTLGFVMGFSA